MIWGFKGATTKQIKEVIRDASYLLPAFSKWDLSKSIWLRNYWEYIIRNQEAYYRITQYILNNPRKWKQYQLNGEIGMLY